MAPTEITLEEFYGTRTSPSPSPSPSPTELTPEEFYGLGQSPTPTPQAEIRADNSPWYESAATWPGRSWQEIRALFSDKVAPYFLESTAPKGMDPKDAFGYPLTQQGSLRSLAANAVEMGSAMAGSGLFATAAAPGGPAVQLPAAAVGARTGELIGMDANQQMELRPNIPEYDPRTHANDMEENALSLGLDMALPAGAKLFARPMKGATTSIKGVVGTPSKRLADFRSKKAQLASAFTENPADYRDNLAEDIWEVRDEVMRDVLETDTIDRTGAVTASNITKENPFIRILENINPNHSMVRKVRENGGEYLRGRTTGLLQQEGGRIGNLLSGIPTRVRLRDIDFREIANYVELPNAPSQALASAGRTKSATSIFNEEMDGIAKRALTPDEFQRFTRYRKAAEKLTEAEADQQTFGTKIVARTARKGRIARQNIRALEDKVLDHEFTVKELQELKTDFMKQSRPEKMATEKNAAFNQQSGARYEELATAFAREVERAVRQHATSTNNPGMLAEYQRMNKRYGTFKTLEKLAAKRAKQVNTEGPAAEEVGFKNRSGPGLGTTRGIASRLAGMARIGGTVAGGAGGYMAGGLPATGIGATAGGTAGHFAALLLDPDSLYPERSQLLAKLRRGMNLSRRPGLAATQAGLNMVNIPLGVTETAVHGAADWAQRQNMNTIPGRISPGIVETLPQAWGAANNMVDLAANINMPPELTPEAIAAAKQGFGPPPPPEPEPAPFPRQLEAFQTDPTLVLDLARSMPIATAERIFEAFKTKDPSLQGAALEEAFELDPNLFEPSDTGYMSEIKQGGKVILRSPIDRVSYKIQTEAQFSRGEIDSEQYARQVLAMNDPASGEVLPPQPPKVPPLPSYPSRKVQTVAGPRRSF